MNELAAIDPRTPRRRLALIAIVLICAFNAYGCATNKDTGIILGEITVTHKMFIPALNHYCEIDDDGIVLDTCEPNSSYAESEDE